MEPTDISIQEIRVIAEGGLQVAYYRVVGDIKKNGVIHLHNLIVPEGDQYDDEIQAILDAAIYLVRDVLEDLPSMDNEHPRE